MEIFMALLMSIAVNLDNFMIGIRLGLDQKPVPLFPNLVISAFTGLFAGIFSGLPGILPPMAVTAANAAGALMILAFGSAACAAGTPGMAGFPGFLQREPVF